MSLDTTWFPNQEMDNAWKIGGNTGPLNKSPEKFIHILDKNKSSVCVFMAGRREEINTTGKEIYPTI
jgi:hypothetical protein